ncbi:MAG: type II toxin-antitoxin system HicB family antitoxin [Candidatus Dormibacteria bacterium]
MTTPTVSRLLTAAVTREGDWHVARCLEVEVASQGRSVEEALANLKEALELYFEDAPAFSPADPPLVTQIAVRVPA